MAPEGVEPKKEWGIAQDVRKIISDDAGNVSSKRVMAVSWAFSALAMWIRACIYSPAGILPSIPWEVCGLVLSLAGVVAVGRWGENKGQGEGR
ncbi:MAG: hypothetical protein E4G97_06200 [Deltaproteobacteria bacterium]|nr:MAG: hypothetical protein E4G97_06200 [Deltaproteobacteria bacterium]